MPKKLTPQEEMEALEAIDHGLSLFQWWRKGCKKMPGKFPKLLENGKRQRWEDGYKKPPNAEESTAAPPGTLDKVAVMARRRREGSHLYHPGDLLEIPIALAQKGNTIDTKNGRCTAEVKKREGYQILIENYARLYDALQLIHRDDQEEDQDE